MAGFLFKAGHFFSKISCLQAILLRKSFTLSSCEIKECLAILFLMRFFQL